MADSDSNIQASGGDYTTTQAWFDAKDSVTGTHTAHIADEFVDGSLVANNGSASATGWVVKPQSGAKHSGVSRASGGSGACLRHTARVIWWFDTNNVGVTVEDMVLEQTAGAVTTFDLASQGETATLSRCIIHKTGTATTIGINANPSTPTSITVQDCIIYGHTTFGIDIRGVTNPVSSGNTIIGSVGSGTYGILPSSSPLGVTNNISVGHSTEDYFEADVGDTNHGANIAEDATATTEWDGAGGSVNNVEVLETGDTPTADYVAFVNKNTLGSEDFHLVDLKHGTHNNVAIGGGIVSKGSGTDIDGESRNGSTPDIGADELSTQVLLRHPIRPFAANLMR